MMAQRGDDPVPVEQDSRLTSLGDRLGQIASQEAQQAKVATDAAEASADYRLGSRVLAELLGGMIGGALIGWLFDRLAGTAPWGLLVMLLLGIISAFRNIIRLTNRSGTSPGR